MKIALIVCVLLLLVGGGAGGWFYYQSMNAMQAEASSDPTTEKGEEASAEASVYIGLHPPFVTNFTSNGEPRFLQVTVQLMTYDTAVEDLVNLHMPRIRDSILMLLSVQDIDALSTRDAKETLREAARTEVDKVIKDVSGNEGIAAVYFTAFVVQ